MILLAKYQLYYFLFRVLVLFLFHLQFIPTTTMLMTTTTTTPPTTTEKQYTCALNCNGHGLCVQDNLCECRDDYINDDGLSQKKNRRNNTN